MSGLDVRAIDRTGLPEVARPVATQELAVFITEAAFDRTVERGGQDTTREIGGVLVGELRLDERGPYLAIDATIDALHADEKGAELTFTHATWDHIHKEMDARYPDKKVVGWYHTHPGFGVFLSDRDQFIHKSFFNLPFQIALVYDPKSREHGVFAWRDNEVARIRRYAIGPREHTWDGDRASDQAARKQEREPAARPTDVDRERRADDRDDDRMNSMASMAVIGVLLLLLGGFAGHWFGASRADGVLAAAQLEIAKARDDGARQALAMIDNELVGLLRGTLSDRTLAVPVTDAARAIEDALAAIEAPLGPDGATPPADPRTAATAARLRDAKAALVRVAEERAVAEAALAQLQMHSQSAADRRADVARDVARQRAGLGNLYAELAADVGKVDANRGRRLLETAAHLDPGNRAAYDRQLQSFAKGQHLRATAPDDRDAAAPGRARDESADRAIWRMGPGDTPDAGPIDGGMP